MSAIFGNSTLSPFITRFALKNLPSRIEPESREPDLVKRGQKGLEHLDRALLSDKNFLDTNRLTRAVREGRFDIFDQYREILYPIILKSRLRDKNFCAELFIFCQTEFRHSQNKMEDPSLISQTKESYRKFMQFILEIETEAERRSPRPVSESSKVSDIATSSTVIPNMPNRMGMIPPVLLSSYISTVDSNIQLPWPPMIITRDSCFSSFTSLNCMIKEGAFTLKRWGGVFIRTR